MRTYLSPLLRGHHVVTCHTLASERKPDLSELVESVNVNESRMVTVRQTCGFNGDAAGIGCLTACVDLRELRLGVYYGELTHLPQGGDRSWDGIGKEASDIGLV